ncbi:hypothetical protein [Pseudomonas fluorescens]|uniref:Uncharacterized protein n=1 Tax=Pseudomonas fluorescens TaxID=294 RepID=A0A944DLW7_PSEFL|nr:hypothetical protein [Pseudomonas fluorescens]MBT2294931.1 hypothetical protein [Pseudomonas fluorescens]MBT2309159.1 hypothetical protein [Pseudomonas fluorescens]MBT2313627.1 hypothetical protein [Pseudomonas fluorescens]MBT2318343.1 hypothetical protein [Pseudomonas fluorescens]MBT2332237.1 hypothetical protein [Pseudomonas fluorescens]
MDVVDRIERARIKAFYKLLVDRLGVDAWAERRAAYVKRIREKESNFDIKLPIESQLFIPADDDIDWYILASYLAHDFPFSDSTYSSRRVYTYAMAIGAVAHLLCTVPNIEAVLDKMLANNNQPEKQLFELLTAAFYLKNGYAVSFIPENSLTWPDGKKRSPDLLVKMDGAEFYVECKRADKQTKYSLSEEAAWASIWTQLSRHMLKAAPWCTVDLTFHDQVTDVSADEVIKLVDLAIKAGGERVRAGSISGRIRAIDKKGLKHHYQKFSVRANSPQHELLVFGDVDSNEKRSIATIAARVIRPGTNNDILNMFVKDVDRCVGAQWRCEHEISLSLRSKHFKGLVNDGVAQIPPDRPGVVHVWYETREGVEIEELRRDKNVDNISNYDASETTVLGVFVHAVNYYPFEDNYEWAETVQDFARIQDLTDLFPFQTLMLASGPAEAVEGTTHWAQDKAAKVSQ